jgi:hypothetical protein
LGHLIFIVLHLIAVAFGAVLLVITIPLHLIYGAASGKKQPDEADELQRGFLRKCPQCAEAVKREALKCKHCGAQLPALRQLNAWEKIFGE